MVESSAKPNKDPLVTNIGNGLGHFRTDRTVSLPSFSLKTSLTRPPFRLHSSSSDVVTVKRFSNQNNRRKSDEPLPMKVEYARTLLHRERRQSTSKEVFVPARFSEDVQDLLEGTKRSSLDKMDDLPKKKKGIVFAKVEIREYPIIVGDHPGGGKGVPLTIDWHTVHTMSWDLDQYEHVRVPHRRKMQEMRMAAGRREKILKDLGFSRKEILWGLKSANIVRNLRRKTNDLQHLDRMHEQMEVVCRKIKNIVTFGRLKRREKKYLFPDGSHDGFRSDLDYSTTSVAVSSGSSHRSILRVRGDPMLETV